jgi:hypothetical protein
MGGEIQDSHFIENCASCKGDFSLRWIDENVSLNETINHRLDKMMEVENFFTGERVFLYMIDGKIICYLANASYYEVDVRSIMWLEPFIKFFIGGSQGKCPCVVEDRRRIIIAGHPACCRLHRELLEFEALACAFSRIFITLDVDREEDRVPSVDCTMEAIEV